jgi:predicted kinase
VDDTKAELYGSDSRDDELGHEDWVKIYDDTDSRIEGYLKSGKSVIDASRNFTKVERERARKVTDRVGAKVVTIFVDTPPEVAHLRLLENRKRPSRRDVSDEGFQDILNGMEPPGPDEDPLIFQYGDEISSWISSNILLVS